MSINSKHANWMMVGFFLIIIAMVFQQIATSMAEQGIASGGPYDNAAAYPRTVALIIAALLLLQTTLTLVTKSRESDDTGTPLTELVRPSLLIGVFATYLGLLGWLGYHLTTTPMIVAVLWLCGVRKVGTLLVVSACIAFVFAFLFESFLKIVLPGGVFGLNIPW